MKRLALPLGVLLLSSAAFASDPECKRPMARAVEAKLVPVLEALDKALKKEDVWDTYEPTKGALVLEQRTQLRPRHE